MQTIVYVLATGVDFKRDEESENPNGIIVMLPTGLIIKTSCFSSNVSFLPCRFYHMTFPDSVLLAQPYQYVDSHNWACIVSNEKMLRAYHFNPKSFRLMSEVKS
jgi:hypothetical protein